MNSISGDGQPSRFATDGEASRTFFTKFRRSRPSDDSKASMLVVAAGLGGFEEHDGSRALVRRCVAGDMSAWRDLHRRYYPIALAFLRKLGVRPRDQEDVCQEVFLQIFRYLGKFRADAELKTWMYQICASQASQYHRRWKLLTRLLDVFSEPPTDPVAPASDLTGQSAQRLLDQALAPMNEGERLVFVLFELEGLSGVEVAEIAQCPINTVWRRLHDARNKFRLALDLVEREAES